MIESPIVCEGKQIDTITYSLSHGSFGVIQPKENPCVLEGTECDTDEGNVLIQLTVNIDHIILKSLHFQKVFCTCLQNKEIPA